MPLAASADAASDNEPRDIMLVVATLPPEVLAKEPRIKPVRQLTPGPTRPAPDAPLRHPASGR